MCLKLSLWSTVITPRRHRPTTLTGRLISRTVTTRWMDIHRASTAACITNRWMVIPRRWRDSTADYTTVNWYDQSIASHSHHPLTIKLTLTHRKRPRRRESWPSRLLLWSIACQIACRPTPVATISNIHMVKYPSIGCRSIYPLIDWLIEWVIYWLTDWMGHQLIDWLNGSSIDWLIEWVSNWLIAWMGHQLIGWLNGSSIDWLIAYFISYFLFIFFIFFWNFFCSLFRKWQRESSPHRRAPVTLTDPGRNRRADA